MRLRLVLAFGIPSAVAAATVAAFVVLSGCSSSSGSGSNDAGEAGPPCSDTLQNVFNNTSAFCPTDINGSPVSITYDIAIQDLCNCHGYDSNGKCQVIDAGIITAGPCNDYLVYEFTPPGKMGYTKCFYKTSDRTLVGISYSDGMMDQCNGTSTVVLAGTTEDWCGFGHYDVNTNCAPKPEAGPDAQSD